MNPTEAREHLELVERIISASSRKLEAGGEFFVCWGVAGAMLDVVMTMVFTGRLADSFMWVSGVIVAAAVLFTMVRSRHYRRSQDGMPLLQREYLNVLWLAIALAFLTDLVGFNIFRGYASMAIWNVVEAIVLLYIGMHGNRRAQIAGVVIVLSIAVANFVPEYCGYILAGGVLFGYAGFGITDLLARE